MAPKDKSERIRLIAWWGARRTSHLGPALLRHLRFEIGRRGWAGGTMLMGGRFVFPRARGVRLQRLLVAQRHTPAAQSWLAL